MRSETIKLEKLRSQYLFEQEQENVQKPTQKGAYNGRNPTDQGPRTKPTERQVWYMKLLAKSHNVPIHHKELTNKGLADGFIQKYTKIPTTKAADWSKRLAKEREITLYNSVLKEKEMTSEFINICLGGSKADLKAYLQYYNRETNSEEEHDGPQ